MTITTPEHEIARSVEVLETLQDAIRALRREIEGLTHSTGPIRGGNQ